MDEFNLLYYIELFKRSWKTIFLTVAIAILLTTIFTYLMPVYYTSTVTLISVKPAGSGQRLGSLGKVFGIGELSPTSNYVLPLIYSRRMANDIKERFNLKEKKKFKWSIKVEDMKITVRGTDPGLVQKIANFAVENLNKINEELELTTSKPMVKVLDPANYGEPEPRYFFKKIVISALFSFLLANIFVFISDYLNKLKNRTNLL